MIQQSNGNRRFARSAHLSAHSQAHQGNRISSFLVFHRRPGLDAKEFPSRNDQEAAGYAEAMEVVFGHSADIPLTENHIKQLRRDPLQQPSKDERRRREYKTHSNNVEAFGPDGESLGVAFETATPFDTPRLMTELIEWTHANLETKDLHRPLHRRISGNSSFSGWQRGGSHGY